MMALRRMWAILLKEILQMRRDRLTLAMLLGIPVMQLILFGYAINTNPKHLPTVMISESPDAVSRSIRAALVNSTYFRLIGEESNVVTAQALLQSGKANFVITVPANFSRDLVRGERPQLLVMADATDPVAVNAAMGHLPTIVNYALKPFVGNGQGITVTPSAVDVVIHPAYNPEGITQWNIIPGLLGTILTMTTVMITSITMTRERERGNMENLLAMPARPLEVMLGKVLPYIGMGLFQTLIILLAGKFIFAVPFIGSLSLLMWGLLLFLFTNLCLGFTFSTIAKTQLSAMQMTFFFFLPSILLSGFMFPFRGMPNWAQHIGEILPLTHFLRILRGVMLKNADFSLLYPEFIAIGIFAGVAMMLAMLGYKRRL